MPIDTARIRRDIGKATSFATVGVLNFGVNTAIFFSIVYLVLAPLGLAEHWAAIAAANAAAWLVAMTFSFVLNSLFTFRRESGGRLKFKAYLRFAASGLVGMVAETATLLIVRAFLPLLYAKLAAIGVSFVVNFTMTRLIVYPEKPVSRPD